MVPTKLRLPQDAQVGESPRLTAIAELLEEAVQREQGRGTVLEARKNIFVVDKQVRGGWYRRYRQAVHLALLTVWVSGCNCTARRWPMGTGRQR